MKSSNPAAMDAVVAISGALAAPAWRELFGWWSREPALRIYELLVRRVDLNDIAVVMGTDLLFALGCGLLSGELFVRLARPDRYRPEMIVVAAFLAALLAVAQFGDEGTAFLLRLPPLWLTLLAFGIRVGYGIKAQRKRLATSV
jgi:hypothetical protein